MYSLLMRPTGNHAPDGHRGLQLPQPPPVGASPQVPVGMYCIFVLNEGGKRWVLFKIPRGDSHCDINGVGEDEVTTKIRQVMLLTHGGARLTIK